MPQVDPVTFLPNRQRFCLDYPVVREPGSSVVMVTLADAKHFNEILRALGHEWSEEFICEGAARIHNAMPRGAVLYHVSVLSFAFLISGPPDEVVRKIHESFVSPIFCSEIPVVPRVGVGVAECRELSAGDALRVSLVAAQDSRANPAGWAAYNPASDTAHRRGFVILSQLSAALASCDQLSLNFQPKIELATGRVVGAEALLRWTHPSLGVISPAEFIPLAEATDHVHKLTEWVLERSLAQMAAWSEAGLDLTLAINVSPHNLSQRGFCAGFMNMVKRHGVDPACVELEFTEGVLASNSDIVISELRDLRGHGVNVALDDFGTGFSNLGYISRLPANVIKIDRSLILPIGVDRRAALVVQSLIDLAHGLNYRVVAEGIETASIYSQLKSWQCDEGQGYHISRPLSAEAFAGFLAVTGVAPPPAPPAFISADFRKAASGRRAREA